MTTAANARKTLRALADPSVAEHSQRFFKTGKGEYGEGDVFLGIRVPVIRTQVRDYKGLNLSEALKILKSKYHEERLFSLLCLVYLYERGDTNQREAIYDAYLENTQYINNWDLVDCSAHKIVGPWLFKANKKPLYKLVASKSLWERRVAVIATLFFIKQGRLTDTIKISQSLLNDKEDLMHKAVGWMLREVGKQDKSVLTTFLDRHGHRMPRTMLRYAIEQLPHKTRQAYLKKTSG